MVQAPNAQGVHLPRPVGGHGLYLSTCIILYVRLCTLSTYSGARPAHGRDFRAPIRTPHTTLRRRQAPFDMDSLRRHHHPSAIARQTDRRHRGAFTTSYLRVLVHPPTVDGQQSLLRCCCLCSPRTPPHSAPRLAGWTALSQCNYRSGATSHITQRGVSWLSATRARRATRSLPRPPDAACAGGRSG